MPYTAENVLVYSERKQDGDGEDGKQGSGVSNLLVYFNWGQDGDDKGHIKEETEQER